MPKAKPTHTTVKRESMNFFKFILSMVMCWTFSGMALADEFLDVDQAFVLRVEMREKNQLAMVWKIAEGYKLYKTSLSAQSLNEQVKLTPLNLPPAKSAFDKGLDKVVETYLNQVTGTVVLPAGAQGFDLEVSYQGCAVAGLCYPPQTRVFKIDPLRLGPQAEVETADAANPETSPSTSPNTAASSDPGARQGDSASEDSIQSVLQGGNLWAIGAAFLVFGLLLSLTPCVLPMLPILSSIIVGQQDANPRRSFLLALSYSLGMALVYTSLGVAAGLVGEGLAAFMQKPWVLCLFALLLMAMALSMFDVFQLQLPASWQGKMNEGVGRFEGGKYLSVFVMGALSSLIVGPCVAGPLAGALLYISQTRDVFVGGFALFVMACGMSVPLLLTGLSAGKLLPRAGAWMVHVKSIFGFMLLGVSLWMVNPLLNDQARLMAWGALLVLAALFTPLTSNWQAESGFFVKCGRAAGVLLLLAGSAEFVGGLMGNTELLSPLKSANTSVTTNAGASHLSFERIAGVKQLDEVLKNSDRPVVLDFYADWCTSCLEMEKLTFRDPQVIANMQSWRRLQVDVTRNTPEDREMMRRFNLFGPPAMIFFHKEGTEMAGSRLVGYMAAPAFNAHLEKISKSFKENK